MNVQIALLKRILAENRQTEFGLKYDFRSIKDFPGFCERVPINEYEALRPYIASEIAGGKSTLTKCPPIRYVRTSGTTDKHKDIPLIRKHLFGLRTVHRAAVGFQYRSCPEAFAGGILAIVSPTFEGFLANGKQYGSASGIVAGNTPALVREKFVLPKEVLTVSNSRLKYLLILRLALQRSDITYISTANATTLLTMMKLYQEHASELADDLREGTFFLMDQLPDEVKLPVTKRLVASPNRALELIKIASKSATVRMSDLWPHLKLIVTWTCGSAGIAVDRLRHELTPSMRVFELGYVSSEFRGTITLGKNFGTGFPTIDNHFFEFVERSKWEQGSTETLTVCDVKKGRDYYLIVTTPSGLYRYFINDLVRVTGFFFKTPLLKFLQKGKGVTNITGEKLYESQVLSAVRIAMTRLSRPAFFVMMLADEENRRYRLYVETDSGPKPDGEWLAREVDASLKESNIEYFAKRESERLGSPIACWLAPETGEAYKQFCTERGQREGQFKIVALCYQKDFGFDLDARVEKD
ncbi:MAG: hypothetical protein JWN94_1245 [Betaproteobacteria bacterium]|nr:hypothetical protein [Betaproteobacteria bacterium]